MSATRFSAIRVLFLALVLAFVASARAEADDHDDHDDHGDEETPVTWACTANCPTAASDPHPCGAGELVESDEYSTCNLTQTNIMDVTSYATTTHVVPCPSDVCEEECTQDATSVGVFNCFNTSVTEDMTAAAANHRGLAVGCPGNHEMPASNMFMRGIHGACEAGYVHFHDDDDSDDHDDSAAARATFAAAALALALALAAA